MADYNLEGPKWGASTALGTAGGLVTWAVDATVPAGFVTTLSDAISDWAQWAHIQFVQVASTAAADFDLAFGSNDGKDGTLAETTYDYNGAALTHADVVFDSSENWAQSGSQILSADGVKFFLVALHEVGHALGLDHYNDAPAVMNAFIDNDLNDLTSSDIDGIQAIYGEGNLFGTKVHDTSGDAGQVYALYDAILGRTPDLLGFENNLDALGSGASLHDLASAMLGSAEGQAHVGAADNATFVEELYGTALGRQSDQGGLQYFTSLLNGGASRADIAIDFALSAENQGQMAGAFNAGVYAPDAQADEVARLYYGVLGRAPDSGGLAVETSVLNQGRSLTDLAQLFIGSSEYSTTHGALNDGQFVQSLYSGALGRQADAGGLSTYTGLLASGTSRATVAVAIAESPEAQRHLLSSIEQGFHLA